jgi:thiol-disulfide isomerase/thioredoxin
MIRFHHSEQIEEMIRSSDLCLVYFSGSGCPVCEPLRQKLEMMLESFPNVNAGFLDVESAPQVIGSYQIFTIPQFLFFVQGKEMWREGKFVDFRELPSKISRYYDLFPRNDKMEV